MANILAFAESRNGELRKVALETVTAARKLADATGGALDYFSLLRPLLLLRLLLLM